MMYNNEATPMDTPSEGQAPIFGPLVDRVDDLLPRLDENTVTTSEAITHNIRRSDLLSRLIAATKVKG